LERIIDDFIFFCFFIGNDFLPYLNTMDIGEGSLDEIIKIYKQLLPELGLSFLNAELNVNRWLYHRYRSHKLEKCRKNY
jgi:5'-3' exoribonuclease 2